MPPKNGMQSREFSLPPKEMMFISRKFIGAYALLVALNARTDSDALVKKNLLINSLINIKINE